MKCQKCGVRLQDGVLFCRECGAKVSTVEKKKHFCRECGCELPYGIKFCTNCGTKLNIFSNVSVDTSSEKRLVSEETVVADHNISYSSDPTKKTVSNEFNAHQENQRDNETKIHSPKKSSCDTIKKETVFWKDIGIFYKIIAFAMVVAIISLIVSLIVHRGIAIFLSIFQIGGLLTAALINNGVIKSSKRWLKHLVLVASVFLTVLNVISYSDGTGNKQEIKNTTSDPKTQMTSVISKIDENQTKHQVEKVDVTIEKGTEYGYMSDEWNVYIATAISDSIIKVENWGKTLSPSKKVKYRSDIGAYEINDNATDFSWVDADHMAFTMTIQDKNNSRLEKAQTVTFTINISDGDEFKGSNYDKKISCYSFINDDWHMYRVIPLTEATLKMECWSRSLTPSKFVYGYDVWVINLNNTDTDFEWVNDEHSACTITMKDFENDYYWKGETFVALTLENKDFIYKDVKSYLDSINVIENDTSDSKSNTEESEVLKVATPTEIAETAAPTRTAQDTEKSESTEMLKATESLVEMPIMKGTSIDSAVSKAKEYGLSQAYNDEDFGHKTKLKPLSDSSGGLTVDIIYSTDTGEILCAAIVTNALATDKQQKDFIKGMASVLCPTGDADEVKSWANENVGGTSGKEINGFVYELFLGPVNNALYNAGCQNWEEWDLSQ